jgi:hypothetical protein
MIATSSQVLAGSDRQRSLHLLGRKIEIDRSSSGVKKG